MIGVTESAKQELKKMLSENPDDPQASFRLIQNSEGQLGLGIGVEQEGDNVVEFEDTKVLLVEEGLGVSLEGFTMDTKETAEGPKLVINKD